MRLEVVEATTQYVSRFVDHRDVCLILFDNSLSLERDRKENNGELSSALNIFIDMSHKAFKAKIDI